MTKLKKNPIMTKLKNSNYDNTQNTQFVTKLKNSNCDKTLKLKWSHNSNAQMVTKL